MIYLGADHRGFELKKAIKAYLDKLGLKYKDLGNHKRDKNDDFPDFGKAVAQKVAQEPDENQGILICGSGVGMDIVANRYKKVRSVLAFNAEHVAASRKEDDTNVLALAADFISPKEAKNILKNWLETNFKSEEKRVRRIKKIDKPQ